MDATAVLTELGFTRYEAQAYAALVAEGELNGYELAKVAGIPRANVYAVAEKLVRRGAAHRADTPRGTRYRAVAPTRLLAILEARHERAVKAARGTLERLVPGSEASVVSSLQDGEVIARARELLDTAQGNLDVAIQPPEAAALADAMRAARERKVGIMTLCMERCASECGGCQGEIHRYRAAPDEGSRWLIVVADRRHALIGEFRDGSAKGLLTDRHLIVELAAAYVSHTLTLATFAEAGVDRFRGLLSEEAHSLLDRLHPDGGFDHFLQNLTDADVSQ